MHVQDIQWYCDTVEKYFEMKKNYSLNNSKDGSCPREDQITNSNKNTILTDEYVMTKHDSMLLGQIDSLILENVKKVVGLSLGEFGKFKRVAELILNDKTEWYVEVVRLTSGSSFGEKALIDNAPRAATITAIHPCYVAVIGRDEYKKCLMRIEHKN